MPKEEIVKVIPRNLTALADVTVSGNPFNTRLESGVDNCYPGLEFDKRNLEKRFFPGLLFEFHRGDGAILREATPNYDIESKDFDDIIYLVGLAGNFGFDPIMSFHDARQESGLDTWRKVSDLLPGNVAVILSHQKNLDFNSQLQTDFNNASGTSAVLRRDEDRKLVYAIYVSKRSHYLDTNGVIDPDTYRPGELTQSLCVPWQYDFRDCGCWYWASNKPDVVTSEDSRDKDVNFMRDLRGKNYDQPDLTNPTNRFYREMDYNQMMSNWTDLQIVVDDQEGNSFEPEHSPVGSKLLGIEEIITELTRLAGVEHALCIEYLYSYYSLDFPESKPTENSSNNETRIFQAANTILSIAIDEMRHLRWVNQVLKLFQKNDYSPVLLRAESISGRLNHNFSLLPLTPQVLNNFVEIEAPSRRETDGLDGMYVRILNSIRNLSPQSFEHIQEAAEIIKLIIDEGEDHYTRFSRIQNLLDPVPTNQWLRITSEAIEADTEEGIALQNLSDLFYTIMIQSLRVAYISEESSEIIKAARSSMNSLHEINNVLVKNSITPMFRILTTAQISTLSYEDFKSRIHLTEANELLLQHQDTINRFLVN